MPNFENLHPNHKLAYLDGVLCGVVVTLIGVAIYKDYKEKRELEREMKKTEISNDPK